MDLFLSLFVLNQSHLRENKARMSNRLRVPGTMIDAYSSDTDSHQHRLRLQRTSSSSSFCSSSSTASTASYRILPVRYSSVDRIIPQVTSNDKGINVRIRFNRGKSSSSSSHHHHHRRHRHHEQMEETMKSREHHQSCPVLNERIPMKTPSNINCIETRSIVRGSSHEQLNRSAHHSSTVIIRDRSLPVVFARTKIQHLPLDTKRIFRPLISRVIREENEEECIARSAPIFNQRMTSVSFPLLGL